MIVLGQGVQNLQPHEQNTEIFAHVTLTLTR